MLEYHATQVPIPIGIHMVTEHANNFPSSAPESYGDRRSCTLPKHVGDSSSSLEFGATL